MRQAQPPAKLTRPIPAKVLPRERLFARLDAASPVTWVAAPAGAGKTILLSSYVKARKRPCLWYQVDGSDADLATFFRYLGLAARQAAPRHRKSLPALTPEYLLGLMTFARRFFEGLYQRLSPPALLVFDNYQEVPWKSQLHEVLRVACEALPAGLRLVVLSRTEPPGAFSRLRAHGELTLLGWEDMRLTVDEVAAMIELRKSGAPMELGCIEQLHHHTQGWAAGLVLWLESQGRERRSHPRGDISGGLNAATQQLLFDYFAGELFERAPQVTRTVLLKTALPPHLTASMAERLTGDPSAPGVLQELLRRNYFITRREEQEPLYEYHPLFRQFLLARATQSFTPAELAQLWRQAAVLLEEVGQSDEAAELYHKSQEWEGLARLILIHAQALLVQGRNQILSHWLSGLPAEITETHPWLLYWRGMAQLPFDQVEARKYFETAFALFEQQDDPAGLYLAWAGVVDTYNLEWRDFKPLDRWIEAFERLHARHPEFPSPEIELRVHYAMHVALNYRQPQHPQLPAWAERSLRLLQACTDPSLGIPLGVSLLQHHYIWRGDLLRAGWVMEALRRLTRMPTVTPLAQVLGCFADAGCHWVRGEPRACLDRVAAGLDRARATGMHACDALLFAQGVYGNLVAGRLEAAEAFLRDMALALRGHRHLESGHHHFLSALLAQQRGDFARGLDHARQSLAMAVEAGAPFP